MGVCVSSVQVCVLANVPVCVCLCCVCWCVYAWCVRVGVDVGLCPCSVSRFVV